MTADPLSVDWGLSGKCLGTVVMSHGVMVTEPFGAQVRALRWRGALVQLADTILCPHAGEFELELLSPPPAERAAVDVRPADGHVALRDGETVPVLRTWHERGLATALRYGYASHAGRLQISIGYELETQPGHVVFVTRSEWAGFRVERPSRWERLYHGTLDAPGSDFGSLVFRVRVVGADDAER